MMPGIGAGAEVGYFYNLERFKFDAEQRQDCIHQMQNMRVAQWGLFREDVRDVFQLSTSNMDNYILVGALIVTAVMNFIFVGYPEFPLEPRWLLLLWNNTVFACIFFGLVSVWLAMHGSIAQRSAQVKILTQAIRPPVPSLKDIEEAMRSQEHFESDGAGRYFQPPAFAVPFAMAEKDEIPRSEPTDVDPSMRTLQTGAPGMNARKGRARPKPQKQESVDWLSDAPFAGEEVLQHLQTVDNGGPGRSAVMHSHFWMLRRVQRGYACFDAYSRICLVLAAQNMLLVCAYYSLGHFMSKMDNWPLPAQNPGAAWLSLIAGAFCTTTLYKLDLFCGPKHRYLVQVMLVVPPALSGLAIHLAAMRTNHGRGGVRPCDQVVPAWAPWALAVLACSGHMLWMWVIMRVSAPQLESSGLPLSFRSTIYLDVFGWHSRHFSAAAVRRAVDCAHWENPEKMLYEVTERRPDHKCLVSTHREAKRVVNILSRLAKLQMSELLTQEELEDLQQLHFTLDEHLRDLEANMALPPGRQYADGWERRGMETAPAWLQSSVGEGTSHQEVYWVDCRSGQVLWSMPEAGQIVDLQRLSASLEELQERIDSPRSSHEPILAAESLPFELMPETPDKELSSSLLPWKCVRLSCKAQMGIWLLTIGVLLFDPKYYDSAIAPRETFDPLALQLVQTDWPHDFFRPSALSCSANGHHLMLGDQFAIYKADVELLGEHLDESAVERMEEKASRNNTHPLINLRTVTLEAAVPTTEIDFAFKSFGFLPGKGKLLLLNQGGTEITEYSLHSHKYVKTWHLSPTLPHKRLEIIQPVEGQEAHQCAREGSGFMNAGWIVYAATDSGQVITLCPTHLNELHPLHMLISLRRRRPSQDVVEVVDSHTGTTKASSQTVIGVMRDPDTGYVWLLNTNTEGYAEVQLFDLAVAKTGPSARWPLPSGRWWVPGLCNLRDGQGLLIAAAADTDRGGQVGGPELWRLVPKQGEV